MQPSFQTYTWVCPFEYMAMAKRCHGRRCKWRPYWPVLQVRPHILQDTMILLNICRTAKYHQLRNDNFFFFGYWTLYENNKSNWFPHVINYCLFLIQKSKLIKNKNVRFCKGKLSDKTSDKTSDLILHFRRYANTFYIFFVSFSKFLVLVRSWAP